MVSFGVSATIGSGIFVSIGYIARYLTGPSLFMSFLLVIVASLLTALCFAEFSGRVHSAGMGYAYSYTTYGELVAFCVGLMTFLSYCLGTAAVARGWAGYMKCFIHAVSGYELPEIFTSFRINEYISVSVLAPVLCCLSAYISLSGMKESAWVGKFLVGLNLTIICGFIAYGLGAYADKDNLTPLLLPDKGWVGVLEGAGLAFFCLIGWDLTCSLSDEVVDSKRTLPRGIVATLLLVGALYCGVSIALCAMVPASTIDESAPVASAFLAVGNWHMYLLVSLGAVTVTSANVLTGITGPPRIIFTMSRDGLLPKFFGRINNNVPRNATVVCAVMNVVASCLFDFTPLASVTSCMSLVVYTVVAGGLLLLRMPPTLSRRSRVLLILSLFVFMGTSLLFQIDLLGRQDRLVPYGLTNLCAAVLVYYTYSTNGVKKIKGGKSTVPLIPSLEEGSQFKCPMVPLIPLTAMWINLLMMASLGVSSLLGTLTTCAACIVLYFLFAPSL